MRLQNGREVTILLRDLALFGEKNFNDVGLEPLNHNEQVPKENLNNFLSPAEEVMTESSAEDESINFSEQQSFRRSTR